MKGSLWMPMVELWKGPAADRGGAFGRQGDGQICSVVVGDWLVG
jgi:hypothetical protein